MSETAYKDRLRRARMRTRKMLDGESSFVFEAKGKAATVFDFVCKDKRNGDTYTRVCLDQIAAHELHRLMEFDAICADANTIIQLIFWREHEHRPFCRAKLYYNQPKQKLPDELARLVRGLS